LNRAAAYSPRAYWARLVDEGGQVRGRVLQSLVVPGHGGVAWQIIDVGPVVAGREGEAREVEDRGDEDDAVEMHAVVVLR